MVQFGRLTVSVLGLVLALTLVGQAHAGPEEAYFKTAQILYDSASEQEEGPVRIAALERVREILDKIVADYPASDIAVRILLKDTIDGLDVAELDEAIMAFIPEKIIEQDISVSPTTAGDQVVKSAEIRLVIGPRQHRYLILRLDETSEAWVASGDLGTNYRESSVFEEISEGTKPKYSVDILGGVSSWQVTEALKEADFLSGIIQISVAEGTLAPGRYSIVKGENRNAVLNMAIAKQVSNTSLAWRSRRADLPIKSPNEAMVLASIIEKEALNQEQRSILASVLANRLARNIRLQVDSTVVYGITRGKGILVRGLRQSELRRPTPYNTYLIAGLPPSPISNASIESLMAAVQPAETDYLFFAPDGSGGHQFAETLEEHNRNVAKWRATVAVASSATTADSDSVASWVAATAATEAALKLDRKAVRDIQARLVALGIDPNGVDGVIGRGTRTAISVWQGKSGIPRSSYLDKDQYEALKNNSEESLQVWLTTPSNRDVYEANGLLGSWTGRGQCRGILNRTKSMSLQITQEDGSIYTGRWRDSLGWMGHVSVKVFGTNYSIIATTTAGTNPSGQARATQPMSERGQGKITSGGDRLQGTLGSCNYAFSRG